MGSGRLNSASHHFGARLKTCVSRGKLVDLDSVGDSYQLLVIGSSFKSILADGELGYRLSDSCHSSFAGLWVATIAEGDTLVAFLGCVALEFCVVRCICGCGLLLQVAVLKVIAA